MTIERVHPRAGCVVACLVMLSSACAPLHAGPVAAPKPVEALDLYRLEQPVEPQLSPDGRTVAVLRQTRDINTDRVNHEIWLVGVADGARRMLVGADRSPGGVRWSPDGSRLAFIGREGGKPQVLVVEIADGRVRAVTDSPQPPRSLSWSPDGRSIAYVALVEQQQHLLVKLLVLPVGVVPFLGGVREVLLELGHGGLQ